MEPMDEMDDVLKALENGENPVIKALQEEETRTAEAAAKIRAKYRAISLMALAISVASIAAGVMTIGRSAFPLIGAIVGGASLTIAANAWATMRNAETYMYYIKEAQKRGNFSEREKRQQWRSFIALVYQMASESMDKRNGGQSGKDKDDTVTQ